MVATLLTELRPIPAEVIDSGVVSTVKKFAYIATLLGIFATQVYRTVSGLTPPKDVSYGRYYESGDPLLQFSESATSVTDLINQGVVLRQTLHDNLVALVDTARNGAITTELAPAVYTAMSSLMDCCATPVDQMALGTILSGFRPPPTVGVDDNVGMEIAFLAARTAVLVRVAALTYLASATATYVPNSSTDAVTVRNQVAGLMDAEMMRLASWYDDADYYALKALRTAVIEDMNTRAQTLAPVVTMDFKANLPSLVLAQILYADATREPDLTARNDATNRGGHPGFLPLTIEALGE
jgi:hypothetical protein